MLLNRTVNKSIWQSFEVGQSRAFAVEVRHTAQNQGLIKLLAKRRAMDKGQATISIEDVKRQLGLE
jgi:hypothetical protein